MEPDKWVMELSWDHPPLNLNKNLHYMPRSKLVKALRTEACQRAKALRIPPCPHIITRLHWRAPDNRRRDEDNIIVTAKPLWDGLMDAGVVPDDTSEFMTKLMPKIHKHEKNQLPLMWLTIERTIEP